MSSGDLLVHATAVASAANGVLILGPSGSGKSDLALRLIAWPSNGLDVPPFTLVSDDQVILARGPADCVEARPPATIAGRLEVRGVGILAVHHTSSARVRLVIQLAHAETIERLAETETVDLAGQTLPALRLNPFEPSATIKVGLALRDVVSKQHA
ncbi:MAG: HPr kinase/phosphorylase [Hyphomicrobiaceae bacterium]